MAGFNLLGQQVAPFELRMDALGMRFAVVINPAVMTAGEASDRIDARFLQCIAEFIGVEIRADAGDRLRCMEVEMNLPHAHGKFRHEFASR